MGALVTQVTIWLALGLFAGAQVLSHGRPSAAFRLSLTGLILFVAHALLAFGTHYEWSHATGYAATAAQTAELPGLNWGGGLYVNYLFGLVWLGELVWGRRNPESYAHRSPSVEWTVRGFFLSMILNGAVVFVPGPQRWLGVALVGVLCWAWWRGRSRQAVAGASRS